MLPRGFFPVAWLLLALSTSTHTTAAATERSPNIVLIMSDMTHEADSLRVDKPDAFGVER